MKKILITGAGSYIGTSFERWLARFPGEYEVKTIDMQQPDWQQESFSGFDAVFHVAGIAHRKELEENADLYQQVNCDLAVQTAQKAKNDGIRHFVFLSSMSVYGLKTGRITAETPCVPTGPYGRSKLNAEKKLQQLSDSTFCISVLRPPMVYGKGCRGNYPRLQTLAKKLPFFPNFSNERSMIFVDTLCEFVRHLIDAPKCGTFFPQNAEYVSSAQLVAKIAECSGKNMHLTKVFNGAIKVFLPKVGTLQKVFGSLTYDQTLSQDLAAYQTCDFEESVQKTEK